MKQLIRSILYWGVCTVIMILLENNYEMGSYIYWIIGGMMMLIYKEAEAL